MNDLPKQMDIDNTIPQIDKQNPSTATAENNIQLNTISSRFSSLVYLRNDRPVLWSGSLSSEQNLEDLVVRITLSPEGFVQTKEIHVDRLEACHPFKFDGLQQDYDEDKLMHLKQDTQGV